MTPIKCAECGRDWFRQEILFQLSDGVFDESGEPEMFDYRYIYRCIPCGSILDLSAYSQAPPEEKLGTVVQGPDGDKRLRIGGE